ncbi:MAG TPA: zinc ribbon domain-containing protein, partial [Byssovorax sp.]
YEYACSNCNAEWEEEQSIKADATKECPRCHEPTAKRQISRGGGFILKGGGWYSDLYASSSNKKPDGESGAKSTTTETKASDASASTSSGGESKSESKSDTSSSTSTTTTTTPTTPTKGSSSAA